MIRFLLAAFLAVFLIGAAEARPDGKEAQMLQPLSPDQRLGDLGQAFERLAEILLVDPNNPVALSEMERLGKLMRRQIREKAKEMKPLTPEESADLMNQAYKALRKASPDQIQVLLKEARDYERDGLFVLAAKSYLQLLALPGLTLEEKYATEKRLRKSIQRIDQKADSMAAGPGSQYRDAFALMSVGDWRESAIKWSQYLQARPKDDEIIKLLSLPEAKSVLAEAGQIEQAERLMESGAFDQARNIFMAVLKQNPNQAQAAEGLERLESAMSSKEKKREFSGLIARAAALKKSGKDLEALELLYGALRISPSDSDVLSTIQAIHRSLQFDRAPRTSGSPELRQEIVHDRTEKRDVAQAETHYQRGLIYYGLRKLREAETEWKSSVKYDPSFKKAIRALERVQAEIQAER